LTRRDDQSFHSRYGPWALVAGGSLGIGAEYARQLAARGLHLVNLAESADPLVEFSRSLASEYRVEVRPLVVDLGSADLLEVLREHGADLEIGTVICNAARSFVGNFLDQQLEDKLTTLDLNCRAPLLLAHEFGARMASRGRGALILMSSLSGLVGTPLVATYAATKAFDRILGEALWEELRRHGVDVLTVVPGATRTPGWESSRADRRGVLVPPVMEPAEVVEEALAALGKRPSLIPGRTNRLLAGALGRILPRRRAIESLGRSMRSQYRAQAAGRAPGDPG
jgi:short-subunit dehydrogenase